MQIKAHGASRVRLAMAVEVESTAKHDFGFGVFLFLTKTVAQVAERPGDEAVVGARSLFANGKELAK